MTSPFVLTQGKAQIVEQDVTFDNVAELLTLLATANKNSFGEISTALEQAATGPIGANNRPRMLKITAFIVHGGNVPNLNGDAFLDEDLEAAVTAGLFQTPYLGMIDFNHDFSAYGVWYSAKYAFDPVANLNGILAEGTLFAWRYTELADKVLAMQTRNGHVAVSAAWLPAFTEQGKTAEGRTFFTNRKPVIFATSLLDVDPADPAGRGFGSEDPEHTAEEREILLKLSALLYAEPDLIVNTPILTEVAMTVPELVNEFRKVVAEENKDQFDKIVELALKLPEVQSALDEAVKASEKANTDLVAATSKISDLEVLVDTAKTAKEGVEAKLAELEAEVTVLREFKATADKAASDAVLEAKKVARLAQLGQAAASVLEAQDEAVRDKLVARWTTLEDDEWNVILASLNAAEPKGQYEAASEKEGALATGTGKEHEGKDAVDKFLRKSK